MTDPPYPGHDHAYWSGNHEHVKQCQRAMNARGYSLLVDGWFGPATTGVTKDFQRWQGLVADGIFGRLTWARA